jgi:serine protease
MKIIKKTLVVLVLCSFIMGTVPISVLAQLDSPGNQIFENKGPDIPNGVEYVPGELIVKFEPGISNREIANINFKHGTSVKYTSPYAGFKILHIPKGKTVQEMVEKYNRNPNVEYAVVNSIAHAFITPNDELYSYQWHLDNDEYGGINMEAAWDISDGTGVIVAVLDSGVAYEDYGTKYKLAPDLANTHFVAGYDFVNNDFHPNDDNSHGTHVAGTIAQSTNNGIGVAGVAYNCTIMPVKVLNKRGSGTLDQLVDGIYFATNNSADVISMSLGWPPGYDPGQPLKDALDYAYINGVTIISASGNDAASQVSYPAAYKKCIAVGATRFDETRASYSNYGVSLDIMAPGDSVLQNTFDPFTKNPRDFGYWYFSGTSMATPHVSGVAALLIANGVTGPENVREALISTAEDKGDPAWDSEYGWGIVDAYAALAYVSNPNTVPTAPTADPNGPYFGTEGAPISFDGSGSTDDGSIVSYDWDFGDGCTGTGIYPNHTYIDDGTYTVTLTVTDNDEDVNTSTTTATIDNVAPSANAGGPYSGSVNISITFSGNATDPGTADVLTYDWDFEYDGENFTVDNSSIDLANPSHTYIFAGTYTVALQVKDDDGGISPISTANVTVTAPDIEYPVISDAIGSTSGTTGEPVTISATITDNVGVVSAAVHYTQIGAEETTAAMTKGLNSDVWSTEIPVASNQVGIITYYIIAQDPATNTATDPAAGTYSINVTDDDEPIAEAGSGQSVLVDDVVFFNGTGSSDNVGIASYSWDFNASDGIGEEATGTTVNHTYTTAGTYTVNLTVTDDAGLSASDTLVVTVNEPSAEIVVFQDSFEEGFGNWVQDSQNDWFVSSQRATYGTHSAEVDGRATDATLTMANAIDLSGKTNATLTFDWFIEGSWDDGEYIKLEISNNSGTSWTEMDSIDGTSRTYSGLDENMWISGEIPLGDDYMGPNFMIRFKVKVSSSFEDGNVDNVKITSIG